MCTCLSVSLMWASVASTLSGIWLRKVELRWFSAVVVLFSTVLSESLILVEWVPWTKIEVWGIEVWCEVWYGVVLFVVVLDCLLARLYQSLAWWQGGGTVVHKILASLKNLCLFDFFQNSGWKSCNVMLLE